MSVEEQHAQVSLDGKYYAQFNALTDKSVRAQADAFTLAFCGSLKEKFSEISLYTEAFEEIVKVNVQRVKASGKSCSWGGLGVGELAQLDEDLAHRFLEQQGQTMTVVEMRDMFRSIDLNNDKKMSFLEYLLWKYDKSVVELFADVEQEDLPILAELDTALAEKNKHVSAREQYESKISELEAKVEGGGFHGNKASIELQALRAKRVTKENMATLVSEMNAKGVKKKTDAAMKVYKDAQEDSWKLEQAKLDEEKATQESERKAGRSKLADRMAAMGLS